ncbi:hypothetical protein EIN_127160 [Entamoeba invadens IP1]|uniref:Leucine rich repeat containing protein BspA family protein n=1 Tax=Entamoeba invadens IP1 TaxID=370355 RepID=L7FMK2_ENTIV|nr:hypothetical protein EIN_127160 [Entamoeba invadens IP1]ELP89528.1 hypothetical protein EIN_127160 [Entamoeba invadens IP1]|eukprot:XP_004256299.1 hypothetical protein EIN_127160 [Entamoeba invadens IP1]
MSKRIDVFSMQIVVIYLKEYNDFINIVLVCKKYKNVLDRVRMNPIQITPKTKNLFKCIQTQKIFSPFDVKLNTEKLFFNYPKSAKECLIEFNNFNVCPFSVFTREDQTYFNDNIPDFVRIIGENTFKGCKEASITLPNSVIEIFQNAFSGCSNITEIVLPPHLTHIGNSAFYNCKSLKEIKLPELLEYIPNSCFFGCTSLSSVNFGTNVTLIGHDAFRKCGFKDFTIDKNVFIKKSIFVCNTLTKITFCGKKCILCSTCCECLQLKEVVMDDNVEMIANYAFVDCMSLEKITLSANLEVIGPNAFSYCRKLMQFDVPHKVRLVGSFAFEKCEQLKELVFGENVVFDKGGCFEKCTSLTRLNVPINHMKYLYIATENEKEIFERLGIEVLNVMKSKCVNESVFKFDNFCDTRDTISNHANYIHLGDLDVFDSNSYYLSEHPRIYIPSTVVDGDIGFSRFDNPIEKIVIPNNLLLIQENDFYVRNAKSILISSIVTKIQRYCFSNSLIKEFAVPQSVRKIESKAFSDSSDMTSLYIPKSVTKIGKHVFVGCTNLKSIVFEDGRHFDIEMETEDQENVCNVTLNTAKLDDNVEFPLDSTKIKVPSSVTKICSPYFKKYANLCEVVLPTTIKKIEKFIFVGCTKLTKITFYDSFNDLHKLNGKSDTIEKFKKYLFDTVSVSYAFYLQMKAFGYIFNNVNLTSKDLELYGTEIDYSVIKSINDVDKNVIIKNIINLKKYISESYCDITKFVIPSKIECINTCNFVSENLREIDISLVTKKVTRYCFSGAQFLQSVTFSNTLEKIGDEVFINCNSLKNITFPKSLKKVGKRCFANCYSLENVCCESKEVVYNSQCFMNCFNLNCVPKIQHLKNGVFWGCNSLVKFDSFENVESIPHCTFMKCYNLREIILPKTLKTIGKFAFKNCVSLESVTFPKLLNTIEDGCYMNCSKLCRVNLGHLNITFGSDVFEGCTSLNSILFENENVLFYDGEVSYTLYKQFEKNQIVCDNVKVKFNDLTIFGIDILKDKKVRRIDEGAFFNNTTITKIEIPNNITNIGDFCFACATQLERVVLPSSITELPPFCFDNCVSLKTINLEHIKKIGMGCFDNTNGAVLVTNRVVFKIFYKNKTENIKPLFTILNIAN